MKKVLHILASNKFSGAENVACTIIKSFEGEYDMAYCSPNGQIQDSLSEKEIKYYPVRKLSANEIKKVVKEYNPDIIHAHDIKATIISSFFSKKIKVISHIHGNHENMRNIGLKSLLFLISSKQATKIIWVSNSALDNYKFKKYVNSKSMILYNVIDIDALEGKILLDEKEYPKYDLIFIGRLSYPKNPKRLIEILKLVHASRKNVKMAIIGNGELEQDVKELIRKYGLNSNVKLYGFQTNPYKILLSSKMLILTSIYEGTPMCALEAIALGKPIISTPTDGLNDIVVQDETGFLSNENCELSKKIIEILDNEELYKKMGKNVKNQNLKINNIINYMEQIKKVYEE